MPRTGSTGLAAAARTKSAIVVTMSEIALQSPVFGARNAWAIHNPAARNVAVTVLTGAAPADRSNSTPDGIARSQGKHRHGGEDRNG